MNRIVLPFLLIILHNASGQPVIVNPELITSLQGRTGERSDLFVQGVQCLVRLTDGKFVTVKEPCAEISRRIEEFNLEESKKPGGQP